ncbi:hypothetical protein PRZ48_013494 [Zasmidium cellare]|uniref:Uncharacterized protein n=1 Tax=Zasmidium cellare TaxID=395010 RepID=A0ABR0E180_ZASCE|nr:hypothetical protein PRZ48_013494 [Zasmidium cellare]
MVKSQIGSNFHRRSGGDERRGIFSKLPPLLIPNSLRRLTGSRHDSKDASPLKSSTSSAIVGIGSALAQVSSKTSAASLHPESSATTSATPTSALPLSALSPSASNRGSADTAVTTPGSAPPGTIEFDIRPGILPDASPGKAYFPVVHAVPDSQAKVITWEERKYNTARGPRESHRSSVLMERCSNTSDAGTGPRIYDASLNKMEVDEISDDEGTPTPDLERLQVTTPGPDEVPASGSRNGDVNETQTAPVNWDPKNPGHDTWNTAGRDEKWQQRSQLFSNLSAFNLRNAQKRKSPPPKQDVGPLWEKLDSTNDPQTPKDVGKLTDVKGSSDIAMAASQSDPISSISPTTAPIAESAEAEQAACTPARTPKVVVYMPDENQPRVAMALSRPDDEHADERNDDEDTNRDDEENVANGHRQSLFDLSDASSDLSSDSEQETEADAEDETDSEPISPLPSEENTLTPFPSLSTNPNSVSVSIFSRTAQANRLASSVLRRTSSTSAALRPVRSRGESIGLQDCSKDPMVLAAGFEKKLRSRGLTTGDEGNRRECFVYRASGDVGREVWEVQERKGRGRGETM